MSPSWNSAPRLRRRASGRRRPRRAPLRHHGWQPIASFFSVGLQQLMLACNRVVCWRLRHRGLTRERSAKFCCALAQVETESSSLIAPPSPLHHSFFCRTQQATRKVRMLQVQRAPLLAPCSSLLFVLQWCSFVKKAPNMTPKALASLQRFRRACQGLRAGWGFGEVAGGGWFSSTPRSWPRGRRKEEEGPAAVSEQGRWNSSRDAPPGQCAQRAR